LTRHVDPGSSGRRSRRSLPRPRPEAVTSQRPRKRRRPRPQSPGRSLAGGLVPRRERHARSFRREFAARSPRRSRARRPSRGHFAVEPLRATGLPPSHGDRRVVSLGGHEEAEFYSLGRRLPGDRPGARASAEEPFGSPRDLALLPWKRDRSRAQASQYRIFRRPPASLVGAAARGRLLPTAVGSIVSHRRFPLSSARDGPSRYARSSARIGGGTRRRSRPGLVRSATAASVRRKRRAWSRPPPGVAPREDPCRIPSSTIAPSISRQPA
jgi:hypothetical protein